MANLILFQPNIFFILMNFHNIAMSAPNMSSFVPQGPFYALQPQINSVP